MGGWRKRRSGVSLRRHLRTSRAAYIQTKTYTKNTQSNRPLPIIQKPELPAVAMPYMSLSAVVTFLRPDQEKKNAKDANHLPRSLKLLVLFALMHEVVDRQQRLLEHLLVHLNPIGRHAIVADLDQAIDSRPARAPALCDPPAALCRIDRRTRRRNLLPLAQDGEGVEHIHENATQKWSAGTRQAIMGLGLAYPCVSSRS